MILKSIEKFIANLFSRRIVIYIVNKAIAINLIYTLKDPLHQVAVFLISSIFDLVVINEINFNKVNTTIEFKK